MSKEVELPYIEGYTWIKGASTEENNIRSYRKTLDQRERQLREALAQIATLTAQVEDATRDKGHLHIMAARNLERSEKAEAELAALREGAREAFVSGERVIVNHPRYHGKGIVQYDTGNQERMIGVLIGNGNTWEYEYDTVTRERILDADGGEG